MIATVIGIVGAVSAAIGWLCFSIKAGLVVMDWTERTGFGFGFYMMTATGLIALPIAIAVATTP